MASRPEGREVKKMPKQEYTAEFKEQAVKHAQAMGIVVSGPQGRPDVENPRTLPV